MTSKRTALAEIDGNRVVGGELTAHIRGFIEGMKAGGASGRKFAGVVSCAESTIRATIEKSSERDEGKSVHRIGRPKVYSKRQERHVIRIVRLHPKISWKDILERTGVAISKRILSRLLSIYNITKWMCAKRPLLT